MNYRDWFVANREKAAALAESFPVTASAVHQWFHKGVPIDRMQGVYRFSKRKVSVAEMAIETASLRCARREAEAGCHG